MHFTTILLLFLLVASPITLLAYEPVEIETESGALINATRYNADGKHLLLWLPSERGMRGSYQPIAMDLVAMGIDVWAIDLHASFMVPESRTSLDEFDRNDILSLLDYAQNSGFDSLTMISAGRGAALAIELADRFQRENKESTFLRGHVFFTPHLLANTPLPGEQAVYLDIANRSNLPVYMIQPEYSTKYARSREIADVLALGGSQVFTRMLKGVAGGFYARPEDDLTQADLDAKAALAEMLVGGLQLLARSDIPAVKTSVPAVSENKTDERPYQGQTLQPYKGNPEPASLSLASMTGEQKSLENYKGKLVLLNFWATWCGPCAEEIPSLSRLVTELQSEPFEVVTVNIGEEKAHIGEFIKDLPVNFEILLDQDGSAVRDWRVYAYPTNFLLDRDGKITHAYRGALEWDSPEVISLIKSLL